MIPTVILPVSELSCKLDGVNWPAARVKMSQGSGPDGCT